MTKKRKRNRQPPPGSSPGTLVIPAASPKPVITLIDYGPDDIVERIIDDPSEIPPYLDTHTVTWIEVEGMGDEALIRKVGQVFGLHPLALEDAVNFPQRPKSETYEHFQLLIARIARINPADADVESDQVSIFFGKHFVLTVQEKSGDIFEPVRARLRSGIGPIRKSGPDYLAYALLDTVVDGYYPVLDQLAEYLDVVEQQIFDDPQPQNMRDIYHGRRQLMELRRALWPQREAVSSLIREDTPLVSDSVRMYLRDTYDHTVQLLDVTETYRDVASTLMDIYLSALGQRSNEVMKVLTVVSAIFIPLTFIAGVYGMNFTNMPEIRSRWGYLGVMTLMAVVAGFELAYFKRRGWLRSAKMTVRPTDRPKGPTIPTH